ncbi:MAG: ribonuclease P protein component [Phycisphaerae bacterium]|jgi:ribonuclease P protein component
MANCKFPKKAKISSKKDFRAIFNHKLFFRNDLMTLYLSPNGLGKSRFAVSISSKIAPAAIRNRLKRLAREAFRLSQNEILPGFDYLIIYSRMLSKRGYSDINPIRGKTSKMSDNCHRQPTSNGIKKITLNEVRQSFIELARQGYKRFDKKHNK